MDPNSLLDPVPSTNFVLYFFVLALLLWPIVLYSRHETKLREFEESMKKNLSGFFRERWDMLDRIFAVVAYAKLQKRDLSWYSFVQFVKERIEKDPNGLGWKDQLPIKAHWLANFAADFVDAHIAKTKKREKDK